MGVDRTDYLMWGVKVDVESAFSLEEELEAEIDGADGRRFDLIIDGMSGQYAVAGKIIAKSDPYDGLDFTVIEPAQIAWDTQLAIRVRSVFPDAEDFSLMLFSHFH